MTDRELTELAAKACGVHGEWIQGGLCQLHLGGPYEKNYWQPLSDDGDALRLAVRLQLSIHNEHLRAGAVYCQGPDSDETGHTYPVVHSGGSESELISDDYIATRRAIVLAAAEIGKNMIA